MNQGMHEGLGRRGGRFALTLVTVMIGYAGWAGLAHAATYYVDCSAATNGTGTSTSSPWNSLASPDAKTFAAGDSLLLKRGTGTSCSGALTPGGSGTSTSPITISAYGTGSQPIINGGTNLAALQLTDQQYWNISDIEIVGGEPFGLFITGDTANAVLHGFTITDVDVNNVNGNTTTMIDGGMIASTGGGIVVGAVANDETFDGVTINGATVENTDQWSGIRVGSSGSSAPFNGASQALSTNVTIENSTVHNVWGSGITMMEVDGGLEKSNVAYDVGLEPVADWEAHQSVDNATPNGIWSWYCHNCTTEYNEAYGVQTPWLDGGDFDIDAWSENQTIQYNYGHDSVGYCAAVLATGGETTNSVVRYNICSNNGQYNIAGTINDDPWKEGYYGVSQFTTIGEFYLFTWSGGSLDGVQIYNNTSYWNPVDGDDSTASYDNPELYNEASWAGGTNFFENNIVYSTAKSMMQATNGSLASDYNDWWSSNAAPEWEYNGTTYYDFESYVKATGEDTHGMLEDPGMNDPTYDSAGMPTTAFTLPNTSPAIDRGTTISGAPSTDFFGNTVPQGTGTDIGADESPYYGNDTSGLQAINAGGDSTGWFGYDNDYIGGAIFSTTHAIDTSGVGAPAPAAVYQNERYGTFTYTIPNLTPNQGYLVRLHESEDYWTGAGEREFNVIANGTQVLTNYDIYAAAGAEYKAVVVEFYVTADSSGKITLQFEPGSYDQAKVDGIEVDVSPSTTTSTINAGGSTDGWFSADTEYSGGSTSSTTHSIDTSGVGAPAPASVYQTERDGNFTYTMTGFTPNQGYLVRLHESENTYSSAGQREFDVTANGTQVLTNYDIYAAAGAEYKAVVPEFFVVADASGDITLQFSSGAAGVPKVDAIEVLY